MRILVRQLACALLLCGALSFPAHAFRSPRVESAAVPSPKRVILEFGHRLEYAPTDTRRQLQSMTISMGTAQSQQFDLRIPWRIEQSDGTNLNFGDIELFYKAGALSTWGEDRGLFGAYLRTTFPSDKEGRTTGDNYQIETGTVLTQRGEHTLFNLNVGSLIQSNGDELARYGASMEFAGQRLGAYAELVGLTDFQNNGKQEIFSAAGGMEVVIGKRITLDLGAEKGITRDTPNWAVFAGATLTL